MKITYRPEIDGLRAIAVVAVILYHAKITIFNSQPFKGGFIGVDIFFVISGYLITSIIFKELIITKNFSFKNFYERRMRRILPALLTVMVVSIPFAWLFLLPTSFVDFSKSVLYSLGFNSNFYFWYSGGHYGDENSLLKPFLHTWSLSVEEQYYILFPITFLIIFKYFRKYLLKIIVVGFVISLLVAEWGSKNYSSFNFYILPSRGWELLVGSFLAYCEILFGRNNNDKRFNLLLTTLGLLLIFISIFFFKEGMQHPSIFTLLPVIGVSLIIWFSHKKDLITKLLSIKFLVGVGLISYSLYLWHYPIFAFVRISDLTDGNLIEYIFIVAILILLSLASYFFIERPSRNRKNRTKFILIGVIAAYSLISLLSVYVITKHGKINKLNIELNDIKNQYITDSQNNECKYSTQGKNFLNEKYFKREFLNCKKKFNKFILILGDSHSINLFNSISNISKKNEFIVGIWQGGCRPTNKDNDNCHYMKLLDFIKDNNSEIKHILFTHKGSYFLSTLENSKNSTDSRFRKLPLDEKQIDNTFKYLEEIQKLNKNLIFIGPHLEPNKILNRGNLIKIKKGQNLNDETNYDLLVVDKKLKIEAKKRSIEFISKIDAIKFNFEKDYIIDNKLTFSDTDHWSQFGELYFGTKLIDNTKIRKILK
tara:strand:- start:115 stop:2070 length:1956 start_codon:yes stop_codon:yes gene_type:complete